MQNMNMLERNRFQEELYNKMSPPLGSHLLNMFMEAREKGELAPDPKHVITLMVHKKGKPKKTCALYRPISVFNTEIKILGRLRGCQWW